MRMLYMADAGLIYEKILDESFRIRPVYSMFYRTVNMQRTI